MTRNASPAGFVLAVLACGLVIVAAATAFMLRQPSLGLQFDDEAAGGVRVVQVSADGPAGHVASGVVLTAIGSGSGDEMALAPFDAVEDPDTAVSYAVFDEFLDRQTAIARLIGAGEVHLTTTDGDRIVVRPLPTRAIGSLPAGFWVQQFVGLVCLLIGAWAYSFKRGDPAVRLVALTSMTATLTTWASAPFIYRELALDGGTIRLLSSLNLAGALTFAAAILALFLIYPRRLVPVGVVGFIAVATVAAWIVDFLRIGPETPAVGRYLIILVLLVGSLVAAAVQYWLAAGDALIRAALRWFGLSLGVGVTMFALVYAAPALTGRPAEVSQAVGYTFALVLNGGLLVAVVRYRLFELNAWAFRILFYTAGVVLLLVLDAVLVYVVAIEREMAFGAALMMVGFLYLPSRDVLARRLTRRNTLDRETLLRAVIDVAFGGSDGERASRWQELLRRLFDPLECVPGEEDVDAPAIRQEGLELVVPAVAGGAALSVRRPWAGRGLFGPNDLAVVDQLVGVMRHVEASRDAYERGAVEERRRIAADLHDDVGARLLTGLHHHEPREIKEVLREAMAEIRTIAVGLSGDRLPLGTVLADLRHEAGRRLDQTGIDLVWREEGRQVGDPFLDYPVYKNLVSTHRELVSNAIRHAGARRIEITVGRSGTDLRLTFADDGGGFGDTLESGRGIGLANIRRRVSALNGALELGCSAQGGARIELVLPLAWEGS